MGSNKIAGNKKGEEGATKEYIKIALTCGENAAKTGCRQEAYHLYEKAAAYDSKDAAYSLFQLYLTSVNIEDEHKAMHWYLQAQQLKHPEASKLMDIEQMRQYKKKMNHFTSLFTPISIRENDYLRVEFYHSCVKIAEYLKMKNFDQYFCQLFPWLFQWHDKQKYFLV